MGGQDFQLRIQAFQLLKAALFFQCQELWSSHSQTLPGISLNMLAIYLRNPRTKCIRRKKLSFPPLKWIIIGDSFPHSCRLVL